MSFLLYLSIVLFIILSVLLILIILIQKGRGGGLASAFGGAGGNTAFGSKTGDVLTWTTSVIFGIFILLAIALNLLANHRHSQTLIEKGVVDPQAPNVPQSAQTPVAPLNPDPGAGPVTDDAAATPATPATPDNQPE